MNHICTHNIYKITEQNAAGDQIFYDKLQDRLSKECGQVRTSYDMLWLATAYRTLLPIESIRSTRQFLELPPGSALDLEEAKKLMMMKQINSTLPVITCHNRPSESAPARVKLTYWGREVELWAQFRQNIMSSTDTENEIRSTNILIESKLKFFVHLRQKVEKPPISPNTKRTSGLARATWRCDYCRWGQVTTGYDMSRLATAYRTLLPPEGISN
ncbi:hypothetical protein J6590_034132 [Homalodisca vitripennis]|nr:hypothetical protein J6590_034132 [Homalodisca vitripennis]